MEYQEETPETQASNDDFQSLPLDQYKPGDEVISYFLPLRDELKGIRGEWLRAEVLEVNGDHLLLKWLEENKEGIPQAACYSPSWVRVPKRELVTA